MAVSEKSVSSNIVSPYLRVEKNCLEIENVCIQISNISLISTTDVNPPNISRLLLALLVTFVGLLSIVANILFGLAVSAIGVVMICMWFKNYKISMEAKRLTIVTNSGNVYPIIFENRAFMEEVMSHMIKTIRDPEHMKGYTIDIKNSTFNDIDNSTFIDSSVSGDVTNIN